MKNNDRLAVIVLNEFDYSPQLRTVGGVLYILIDDNIAFPEKDWFDLPVSILDMWLSVLIDNASKRKSTFNLFFLDGPFYIKCCKNHENLKLEFIDNRSDEQNKIYTAALLFNDFTHMIGTVAKKLMSEVIIKFGDVLSKNEVLSKIDVLEKSITF
jgi:hypothetical protein